MGMQRYTKYLKNKYFSHLLFNFRQKKMTVNTAIFINLQESKTFSNFDLGQIWIQ